MATYATSLLIAIHNAVVTELGSGAKFVLLNSSNTVLATIPLNSPAGIVDQGTGVLSISFNGRDDSADASGTAANFQLRTSADAPLITGPVRSGTSPLTGYLTLSSTTVTAGMPVEVSSLTFG